ncbi:MAG: ParB/RepB/Spo0J family partition protein, partial [Chloroflexi bacterium]
HHPHPRPAPPRAQPQPGGRGRRAHPPRPSPHPLDPGGRGGAQALPRGDDGHHRPSQRPAQRGAEPRPADQPLRPRLQGGPGLRGARRRVRAPHRRCEGGERHRRLRERRGVSQERTPGAPRRRGLGRGLGALLSPGPEPQGPGDSDEGNLIQVDPTLAGLADSIRSHGLLQPIVVERDGDGFQLVAGERRLRAAALAGLSRIPAILRPATQSGREALELALVENLQRTDLSALDEAAAYARLADAFGLSHEAIALRVGRSRATVTNTVRLLALPAMVQSALREGRLTAGHARALLGAPTDADREELAEAIGIHGLSVRQVEHEVGRRAAIAAAAPASPTRGRAAPQPARLSADDRLLERSLEEALGAPVTLRRRRRGGQLIVDFHDDEQLDDLYTRLGGAPL